MKKFLLCFSLFIALLLVGCGNIPGPIVTDDKVSKDISNSFNSDDTDKIIGSVEADVFDIKTNYCTLKFPNEWKDEVTVNVADDIISFVHTETGTKVFDIVFGGIEGDLLGILKSGQSSKEIRIISYELDSSSAFYDSFCAIEYQVNVIINHLALDYDFELA